MKFKKTTLIILILQMVMGLAIRFTSWINPGYAAAHLSIFDAGIYTEFSIAYVNAIKSGNFTALTTINPGVPPLGMILTGVSVSLFEPLFGAVHAGILAPMIFSTMNAVPIYLLAKKYSEKYALAASALFLFDPFVIQFSVAYLDAIGTFFMTLSTMYLLQYSDMKKAILTACLAVLSKLTFVIFVAALAVILTLSKKMSFRDSAFYCTIPFLSLAISPWFWSPSGTAAGLGGNLQFNALPFSVFLGPFSIGIPEALPWYILSYFGMGSVYWNTLPYFLPFMLLVSLVWSIMRKSFVYTYALLPAAASVLAVALIPRNYWTYSWGAGFLQGILTRQLYPYYFYVTAPFLAVLTVQLLCDVKNEVKPSRIASFPPIIVAILSPMAIIMNSGYPYWDFVFNLIYSYSLGFWVVEGLSAIFLTTAFLALVLVSAEAVYRQSKKNQSL